MIIIKSSLDRHCHHQILMAWFGWKRPQKSPQSKVSIPGAATSQPSPGLPAQIHLQPRIPSPNPSPAQDSHQTFLPSQAQPVPSTSTPSIPNFAGVSWNPTQEGPALWDGAEGSGASRVSSPMAREMHFQTAGEHPQKREFAPHHSIFLPRNFPARYQENHPEL